MFLPRAITLASPLVKNDVVIRLTKNYKITPANVLISLQANTPNVNGRECDALPDLLLLI